MAASLRDASPSFAQPEPRGTISPKRNAGLGDPGLRDAAKTALRSDLVLQLDHRCRSRGDNFLDEINPIDLLRQPLAATSLADLDSAALDLLADAGLLARTVTTVCPADLKARLAEVHTERDLWLATGMAGILITLLADRRPSLAIDAAEAVLTRLPQSQSATLPRGHAARWRANCWPAIGLGRRRGPVAGRGPPSPGPLVIRLDRQSP